MAEIIFCPIHWCREAAAITLAPDLFVCEWTHYILRGRKSATTTIFISIVLFIDHRSSFHRFSQNHIFYWRAQSTLLSYINLRAESRSYAYHHNLLLPYIRLHNYLLGVLYSTMIHTTHTIALGPAHSTGVCQLHDVRSRMVRIPLVARFLDTLTRTTRVYFFVASLCSWGVRHIVSWFLLKMTFLPFDVNCKEIRHRSSARNSRLFLSCWRFRFKNEINDSMLAKKTRTQFQYDLELFGLGYDIERAIVAVGYSS